MLRHIVCVRWTEQSTPEQRAAAIAALRALPDEIASIRRYQVAENAGIDDGNADMAIVADFDDLAGYITYRDHPVHQALIRERMTPIMAERAGIQIQV